MQPLFICTKCGTKYATIPEQCATCSDLKTQIPLPSVIFKAIDNYDLLTKEQLLDKLKRNVDFIHELRKFTISYAKECDSMHHELIEKRRELASLNNELKSKKLRLRNAKTRYWAIVEAREYGQDTEKI